MTNLFDDMAAHPDIAPVFDLLKLLDPVDEFTKALCLVRDCFSPSDTLRCLSRRSLRKLCRDRLALMRAYEQSVCGAAGKKDFGEALMSLSTETYASLRGAYMAQVRELMQ